MQRQRFELKYLITEESALMVRDFVRSYLDFDEYSVGKPNYSYPVHSLYLDSDRLQLYWETINTTRTDTSCASATTARIPMRRCFLKSSAG